MTFQEKLSLFKTEYLNRVKYEDFHTYKLTEI